MLREYFKRIIMNQVIAFALRQLKKFTGQTDWEKIKADWEPRIRDIVPLDFFDDQVVEWANALIDMFASVLSATDTLAKVITLLTESKFNEAWQVIRDLILEQFKPETPVQQYVYDCVDDCKSIV